VSYSLGRKKFWERASSGKPVGTPGKGPLDPAMSR